MANHFNIIPYNVCGFKILIAGLNVSNVTLRDISINFLNLVKLNG